MHHQLVHVAFLTHSFYVIYAFQAEELCLILRVCALSSLFLEYEHKKGAFFLAFTFFRAPMEEDGYLVDFNHHIGEEKFVPVLWLDWPVVVSVGIVLSMILASSLMQINPIPKSTVVSLDLPDRLVYELME